MYFSFVHTLAGLDWQHWEPVFFHVGSWFLLAAVSWSVLCLSCCPCGVLSLTQFQTGPFWMWSSAVAHWVWGSPNTISLWICYESMQYVCFNTLQVWLHKHTGLEWMRSARWSTQSCITICITILALPTFLHSHPPVLHKAQGSMWCWVISPLLPKLHAYKREWKGKFRLSVYL